MGGGRSRNRVPSGVHVAQITIDEEENSALPTVCDPKVAALRKARVQAKGNGCVTSDDPLHNIALQAKGTWWGRTRGGGDDRLWRIVKRGSQLR